MGDGRSSSQVPGPRSQAMRTSECISAARHIVRVSYSYCTLDQYEYVLSRVKVGSYRQRRVVVESRVSQTVSRPSSVSCHNKIILLYASRPFIAIRSALDYCSISPISHHHHPSCHLILLYLRLVVLVSPL